jgi:hypothetical protein
MVIAQPPSTDVMYATLSCAANPRPSPPVSGSVTACNGHVNRSIGRLGIATLAQLLDLMGDELTLDARPIDCGIDGTLIQENLKRTPKSAWTSWSRSRTSCASSRPPLVATAEYDPTPLLELLVRHGVDFVLVGGLAAAARGSARATFDLDIAYARDDQNLERLAAALQETGAKLRGAPADVPFLLDPETLKRGSNLTFATRNGPLDILGDPPGAPSYRELRAAATPVELRAATVHVASLDHMIAMKEASGRSHDNAVSAELRLISDELRAG